MLDPVTSAHARRTMLVLGLTALAAAGGLALAALTPDVPGSEPLTIEDVVDVVADLALGVLGAALLWRGVADGLARALMLLAAFSATSLLLSGLAQALAQGEADPPAAARLLSLGSEAAFVASFFLLLAGPLLLFPTGRLPGRRWRWSAGAVVAGCAAAMLSVLLAPGPVDDDNAAWGDNPIGVPAARWAVDALEAVGLAGLALGLLVGVAAVIVRWIVYRGPRRRQMAWFTLTVAVVIAGAVLDLGGSVAVQALTATAIFCSLLAGMAWPLLGPLGAATETSHPPTPHPASRPAGAAPPSW